jgi:Phosphate-selective porin O and P
MKNYYFTLLLFVLCLLSRSNDFAQEISYKAGDGLHIKSEEQNWDFLFSGYINSIYSFHNSNENDAIQNSFSVHRARIDLGFDYMKDYALFFEFDAAGQRTEMVLAQVQARLFDNNYLLAGKFIDPFSPENNRSTSRLTTIERYNALNSIFLLPGLDAQYGIMFFGSSSSFNYYLSVTNGNGEAAQNLPENNENKAVTARLEYKASDKFNFGGSIDFAEEKNQALSLVDHTFESFNNASINGPRTGYLINFEFKNNPWLFRGESFYYDFQNSLSNQNQLQGFLGGYLELGYFLYGNEENGLQLIGRYESARYEKTYVPAGRQTQLFSGPSILNSYLLGTNWLAGNVFSFQVNLIYEDANRPSVIPLSRMTGRSDETLLLTTFQLRF